MQRLLLSILGLASLARTAPQVQGQKSCQEYTVPVNITSLNYKWSFGPLNNNEDVAAYLTESGRRDAKTSFNPVTPPTAPETASYTISGTFCRPGSGGNGTVLLATHGGGYDRLYWDPLIQPENYSFVDHAVAQGYSVFYYDRVGIGRSEMLSGYVAQASIHGAVLKELVDVVRSDTFGSPATKVVLVGHSLGSAYSNVVLHSSPEGVDAAVLTGAAYNFSDQTNINAAQQPRLANLQNPIRWGNLDGWTTWADIYSGIQGFFKAPYYDPEVVQWAEDYKQPSGLLELYSAIQLSNFSSPGFTGPLMVMSGEYDAVACGGYCGGILEDYLSTLFPASKNVVAYVQPGSGHGINLSLNATGAFGVITDFLRTNGL